MNHLRAYLDTSKKTASKERLMVMLFEAALRHIRTGAAALEAGRNLPALAPLSQASDIVDYLMATFDTRQAPELGKSLGEVYTFVVARLIRATSGYDAVAAREAERVFAPLVAAFAQAAAGGEGAQPAGQR